MRKSYREENGEKVFRYSIRKYHFGAASVAVAALMFFANGAVKADPLAVSPATANTEKVNAGVTNLTEGVPLEKSLEAEGNKEIVAPESAEETSNKKDGAGSSAQGEKEIKVSDKAVIPANQTEEINKAETNGKEKEVVTNKDKLESLLKEIDQLNLKDYTEATVKVLQEKVAKAKEVLVNATTQKEIDSTYNALVGYKNAGLKRVPKPKGELTPKPDTTNGKATVGIKAENTEPNGTNIAGHNHSLAGTSLPEGSSFRTAPAGDVTFYYLDGSMETEAGRAPDARYILKFRRGRSYRPQYTSATTTGAYLDYTGQRIEGEFVLRTFATRGSDAEVGSYDFRLRFTDSSTGEIYVDQALKVNVKPNKPTVTVENLENAAGKRAVVKSTARNSNDSIVEFYLNNTKKATITAVNGTASWTPDEALQTGDRITTRNIARDREFIPATYGGNINVERSTSDMSDVVTIPTPTTPTADKTALNTALSEETATKASEAYYNGTTEKKTEYDNALKAGKEVKDKANATQEEVTNAVNAINAAKGSLDGQATDKTALNTALSEETATKASEAYYNGTTEKKTEYDNALKAGKEVKDKANATQEEVTNAVNAINAAKGNLDGQATDKTALNTALSEETTTKASEAYYNATSDKKTAYDNAVTAGKAVLAKDNATQTEVNNALSAISTAKNNLGGVATNKDALRTATTTGDTTTKGTPAYYNAEASKKDAYDQAVTAGKAVLAKDNATQTEVNDAVSAITNAKNALGGRPTNKGALQTATSTGDTETKATAAYYNAEASKKTAYDNAVTAGKVVLAKDNATQTEVNDAVSAINTAKNNLGGVATNKDALRTATSTGDTETKATAAYYNAEASEKDAYDQAVTAGKAVLAKDNATQTEVNNALSAINTAKDELGGNATNKDALQTATSTGDTETKATAAYYNAEASKKTAYDNAVAAGKAVLAKDNATQTEVNDAVSAINTAKNNLGGVATNKDALQTATSTGDTETKATAAYYNAEASKKDAYDQAVTAGKAVLAKDNATQTEVNDAVSAITNAKNALGGNATNKDALQTATSTGDTETKATAAYYNAEASKKDAYDQAVTAGKAVLAKDNATQTEVNDAVSAITNAKNALGGNATNKDVLQTATSTGDTETKATAAYYNAEASKKTAYDNAVTAGKAVLAKDNATQTEVNDAVSAINTAKNNLGGVATNKDALRTATSTGDTTTKGTPAYYNAEASKKTAYDNAVAAGKVVLAKDNATQTEVNNALSAISTAKNNLGGVATNKDALRTATTTGDTTTKGTPAYYNAEASKKTAYDNAVASGKTIFNKADATQTEVDNAVSAITNAKNALGGNATNKDALQTATRTGDTETKATAAYYNAEASKKTAYDNAVTAGKVVLAKDNATQTEVNNALSAINTAKNNLGGVATNKDALRTATSTGDTETKATAAYYNAEASEKDAYDQAVTAGKAVLAKDNATQTEVNNALSAINTAKDALGGNATNKDALQTATSTGDTETKATAAYYNAEASKKDAYDQAVTAGKAVLAKDNATQTEVNDAVNAINAAKEKLDGAPFPTEIEKSNAIAEVKKALDTKIKSIESSKEFTDNDKGILKDKAEKAAMAAIVRIKTATTNAAVETAKIEGIERINSIEANLPATLDFPEFTGEVNGEIVEPTETLKEEQGGENKPQPASAVPSDDTTREPEVVTSNSQPVSSENNVLKQNDSESHATLPNTGTKEDRAAGALGILSLLGAFGLLFAKKKKDDEEEA